MVSEAGSDSQAFVTRGNEIINMVKQGRAPKRRWQTQKDGDLWGLFMEAVRHKGPHAVKLAKVVGHATDKIVLDGKVEKEAKMAMMKPILLRRWE